MSGRLLKGMPVRLELPVPAEGIVWDVPPLDCAAYTGKGKARRVVPGKFIPKLVGYYTKGGTPNWSRLKEYEAWKDHVRRHSPPVPAATGARPVRVDVWCVFGNGTHADPENIRKGLVDALFPGGDKFVYGYHHHPLYSGVSVARVIVTADDGEAMPRKGGLT